MIESRLVVSIALGRINRRGIEDAVWLFMVLLASSAIYFWLGWREVPGIVEDQGWFLQVSRRVAGGEVLYRDVWWAYGPLPVLIMSGLMRLGNHDIVYFSLLHLACVFIATWTLYRLGRHCLSPQNAAVATFSAMVAFGGWLPFLRIYTPGISIGLLNMLVTLLGLVGYIRERHRFKTSLLVALGLVGSWLSKPEFAFGSLLLSLIVLGIIRTVRLDQNTHPISGEGIAWGILIGMAATTSIYWCLANQTGWLPLLAGISGYSRLQEAGVPSLGYYGPETLKTLSAAVLLTVTLALAARAYISTIKHKSIRSSVILSLGMGLFYLTGVFLWQSGWLSAVGRAKLSIWDISALLDRVLSVIPSMPSFLRDQLFIAISLLPWLLLLLLAPRWLRRIRHKESVSLRQLHFLIVLAYTILVGLRYFLFGSFEVQLPGLVLILPILHAEFSALGSPIWLVGNWRSVVIVFAFIPFCLIGVSLAWSASYSNSAYLSPHGEVFMYPSTRSFLAQAVGYIRENSIEDDYVAILGPFPGLYYLSQRHNPFLQDYMFPGVGDSPADVEDILARLDRYKPAIVIVLRGNTNTGPGVLDLFGSAKTKIASYVSDHYRLDQTLGGSDSWELSAFKRWR